MKIEIPASSLVVLIGPAASGKSTFARKHFKESQIVSSDRCRELVCDDEANQEVSQHAFDLLYFLLDRRLYFRRLTVVDSTALSGSIRHKYLEIARWHGCSVVYIVFNHSLETCLKRNLTRKRVLEEAVIKRQHEKLQVIFNQLANEGIYKMYVLDETNDSDVEIVNTT